MCKHLKMVEMKAVFSDFDQEDETEGNTLNAANILKVRHSITKDNSKTVFRTKLKVIRYVKYNLKVDPENYYRELLMLFHPWRNEETDLLKNYKTYKEHFEAVSAEVQSKKKEYDANTEVLDEVEAATETQIIDNFDDVSPNIESVEAVYARKFYSTETRKHTYYDLGPDIGLTPHASNDDIEVIQSRLPERDY